MGTLHKLGSYGDNENHPSGLAGGNEPPHDDGMKERIDRLDRAVERIDADLGAIKVSAGRIEERLSHMPTSAELLRVVSNVQWTILGALLLIVLGAALKWAWPFIFK
ncbi:hypothetical protein [Rhodanobacter sp. A1T4]|uniref:hypothetical protein n=1 Tax=Rhodanobacter sp. A1T4 TaxID=2723087 RepID=UPI001609BDC6|nr:hypothetical protein [Rhodanobacter sp. A1T4]MBB6246178.1 hypothetical protein [Rhodanobacter sp. A1T4]